MSGYVGKGVVLLAGCSNPTTAPTVVPTPTVPVSMPDQPADPTFNPTMWKQLIYGSYEDRKEVSWILDELPVNVRVVTAEEDGTVLDHTVAGVGDRRGVPIRGRGQLGPVASTFLRSSGSG